MCGRERDPPERIQIGEFPCNSGDPSARRVLTRSLQLPNNLVAACLLGPHPYLPAAAYLLSAG